MNFVFFVETLVLLLQKHAPCSAPSLLHAVFTPPPLAVALLLRLHICSPPFTVALLLRLLTFAHHSPRRSSSSSPSLTTHHRRSSSSSLTTHRDIEEVLSLSKKNPSRCSLFQAVSPPSNLVQPPSPLLLLQRRRNFSLSLRCVASVPLLLFVPVPSPVLHCSLSLILVASKKSSGKVPSRED
ncbi:uncharacterized protein [Arachis hypogaea]|uniref:uncharacterized protein n=1 Tax=Arachis hypogaea TaxID=3818 RepID=UPI003B217FBA